MNAVSENLVFSDSAAAKVKPSRKKAIPILSCGCS